MLEGSGHEEAPPTRSGDGVTRRWRLVLRPTLVFLAYSVGFLALDAATEGLKGSLSFSLWFPPVGLTFALLLVFGTRYTPAVALVFLLHLILFREGLSYPVAILFAAAVCYTVLYAGAAALLVRALKIDPRLTRMRDVAWFVGVACFSAPLLASATVVSGTVLAGYVSFDAFWENFLGFWAGDATGIGVLTPFLLVASRPFASLWASRPRGPAVAGFRPPSRRELPEVGLQVLALALSLAVAYGGARGASLDYAYLAFAPLVWVALRGGFERTTVALLLINVSVVVLVGGTVEGANPTLLQFGLMVLTLVGLLLGGLTTARKRAEEAVRESERRFSSVVHNSSEAVTILDPDGTLRYVSPAFERLFGYEPEEVVGKNVNDYIHPEDLPRVAAEAEKALAEPGVARNVAEHRLRHKDGSWRHVETVGTYLLDDPAVQGVVVNARDVSERKKAEKELKESHDLLRAVMEGTTDAVFVKDLQGRYLLINQAGAEALGRSVEEVIGKDDAELFSAESGREVMEEDREIIASGKVRTTEDTKTAEGITRTYLATKGPYRDGRSNVAGTFGVSRDITERKEAEEALRQSEERFRTAFEDAPIGVALVGLDMRYLRVNQALCEMLGYSQEELLAKTSAELVHPDDREIGSESARQALEEGPGSYALERRYVRADGRVAWNLTSVSLIRDSEGDPSHFVCLHQDITERKELEERLEHQAFHDSLTGLPNRALLLDRLKQALARAERRAGRRGVAVLFLDLDDFKVVNDSLGHEAGDELLIDAARRLKGLARSEDTVARLGGDEFCVLLEDANAEEAARVAERILTELKGAPFLLGEGEQRRRAFAAASIGVALSRSTHHRPSELLKEADLAMYRAKEEGKGRHAFFEPRLSARARERARLEGELRRAIEREELELYYQPKVCLRTGRILWMEALLRWEHPERGLLLPERFVPLAEETGLIVPIGLRALEEALWQGRRWREKREHATRNKGAPPRGAEDRGSPPGVCVNLSARQLSEEGLVEEVRRLLARTETDPGAFGIEVTESVLMENKHALSALEELRGIGVMLSIDDFGTGYSSLSYLKKFPADLLKIDCSFVKGLGEDPEEAVMVSGMVTLAHATGKEVVAECVENSRQLTLLKEIGCEMGQGNYFSEPLPAEAAARLVEG